jgi:iron complex transport system substrate-binding protein
MRRRQYSPPLRGSCGKCHIDRPMRIASLVPSATEMLFALGLGGDVVAVTHECDYPPGARSLPHLTRTALPAGLSAADIDRQVKARVMEGRPLYELDEELLAELAPDLIVTQALCEVCAVSFDDVVAVAARLPSHPRVIQQDPSTLNEMLDDVVALAEAAGVPQSGHELRGELEGRIAIVRSAVAGATTPRVVALEWLDPPFVAGHWVPEMISIAGGEDVAGPPGLKSPEVSWGELSGLTPDVIVAMPCGWYVDGARSQVLEHWFRLEELNARQVFAVDAASTFSRPGPRLVDGVELLGHLLHPDLVGPPGSIGFAEVRGPDLTAKGA